MNKNSKIYVAGHEGMVGSTLLNELFSRGYQNIITKPFDQLDLRNQESTNNYIKSKQPEYVFLIAGKVGGIQANIKFPGEYLYDNLPVNDRWCLVHATHVNEAEVAMVAKSKAVVALCPSTEANLGDGIFPIQSFLAAKGRFAIGSDSHVTINPMEELRQLEYVERLSTQKRIVLDSGANLWQGAVSGGAQVMGQANGLCVGAKADVLVLDERHPSMAGRSGDEVFDALVFTSHGNPIKHVLASGNWVIKYGQQKHQETILSNYNKTIISLMERR